MSEAASRYVNDSELLNAIETAAAEDNDALNGLPNMPEIAAHVGLTAETVRSRCRDLERRGLVALHESAAFKGESRVTTMLTVDPEGGDQTTLEVADGDA